MPRRRVRSRPSGRPSWHYRSGHGGRRSRGPVGSAWLPWTRWPDANAGDRSAVGVVLGEEAPRLAGRDGGLTGRAAGPEVAPAALLARDRREGGVRVLPRSHRLRRRGDVHGDVLLAPHVVGQRPLGVLEGGDRAARTMVQLHPAERAPQGPPRAQDVGRQGRGPAGLVVGAPRPAGLVVDD